ncbi:Nop17l [Symbiodinium necroappetens]|uniref:Nop17l protein n=1 Tax=Symbiodinium necroappetens TaxID=1628268 RepID=A0A812NW89_9DINO|nr:Nop17l [Symbiodinium necroappetens]
MAFAAQRRKPGEYGDMTGITQDEVSKLQKAMKQKEFRDHIEEYTREVSDPAHRQEYLDYLAQIEAKGEMPEGQQLLRCQPGLCVKTNINFKSGQKQKCFINIVHTDRLEDLTLLPAEAGSGHQVHLPYSLSPPRPDRDLKDEYCMTCDFAVSTGTFQRAAQSSQSLPQGLQKGAGSLKITGSRFCSFGGSGPSSAESISSM